jgi:TonB family protein
MRNWFPVTLMCALLGVGSDINAAQVPTVPVNPARAQTSLGFNLNARCPDLRIADEGTIAVVIFWLPSSGKPSRISVKSSSGSNALDSAAISCVSRLRFAAATRLGDGEPIDSWQQIALRWADQGKADDTQAPSLSPSAGAGASVPIPPAPRADHSAGQVNSVTVRVCVDDAGKLKQDPTIVRSSGNPSLDQAAVRIAASGTAYYRPATPPSGPQVSGCAQLAIEFESK